MSERILIAEDDTVLADILRFNLQQAGFEVVVANDGLSAANHVRSEPFDLVVSDHQMPGMTGYELCKLVRQESPNPGAAIYFCSAKGYELDTEKIAAELDIARLVVKPFSPRELVESIRETLGTATAAMEVGIF